MSEPLLSLNRIEKSFGAHKVLEGIDLAVRPGEVVGLLGPNGSGKSTLLNILSGFSPGDAGTVRLAGTDVTHAAPDARARLGLVRTFQLPSMPTRMTVREVLEAGRRPAPGLGTLFGACGGDPEVEAMLDSFLLRPVAGQPASALSGGQKKLLSIAAALRGRPALLCLDEPTAGVHPQLRRTIAALLRAESRKGLAILVVEHDMLFIRELCDRCVVLDRGALIADCPPADLAGHARVVEAYLGKAARRGAVAEMGA